MPRLRRPSGLAVGGGLIALACLAPILSDEVMTGPSLVGLSGMVLLAAFLWGAVPAALVAMTGIVGYWGLHGGFIGAWHLPSTVSLVELSSVALLLAAQITLVELLNAARRDAAAQRLTHERQIAAGEAALAELQHRVANTMQFVASLLSLQADRMEGVEAQEALNDAAERLGAMANVHRRLHDSAIAEEAFEDVLREVASGLLSARGYTVGPGGVMLSVQASSAARLGGLATLNALALIVAEAVTNAAKHAFINRHRGVLTITIEAEGTDLVLAIVDDGPGPPGEIREGSLGLAVMQTMAQRLGGSFTLAAADGGGARVSVTVPVLSVDNLDHAGTGLGHRDAS